MHNLTSESRQALAGFLEGLMVVLLLLIVLVIISPASAQDEPLDEDDLFCSNAQAEATLAIIRDTDVLDNYLDLDDRLVELMENDMFVSIGTLFITEMDSYNAWRTDLAPQIPDCYPANAFNEAFSTAYAEKLMYLIIPYGAWTYGGYSDDWIRQGDILVDRIPRNTDIFTAHLVLLELMTMRDVPSD